ncbi:DeoR/GlpR transcriptional regulator [Baekduia soli]|uniref:DeoR/GlpR transcriptional regulator n=1 Tax=Baekduia soli TaxID=496014 RepID=A0A5B8UCN5_9ACTN|nr:DeoR/GlpR family DNA-binding transcription regulator [Baekduia soli]QEC50431.1 DeoR/GlpR transcriptional regulator [Baekduia soli]
MLPAERRRSMEDAVRSGMTEVGQLAARFKVSEMTVRRDLQELQGAGRIERVRGGAVPAQPERPFTQTVVERLAEKERIGAAAAALVQDGQTVMIDVGTTALQAARGLRDHEITVITTNLAVYEELLSAEAVTLVLPGGQVRRNYRSLVGFIAEETLRTMSADIAFLGASGIDRRLTIRDSTIVEVPIKRAMLAAAHRTVLLADAAKFTTSGFVSICEARDLDTVVTDTGVPDASRRALEAAGVEVIVA